MSYASGCKYASEGYGEHTQVVVRGEEGFDVSAIRHLHPVVSCPKCGAIMEHAIKGSYPYTVLPNTMHCLNDECYEVD